MSASRRSGFASLPGLVSAALLASACLAVPASAHMVPLTDRQLAEGSSQVVVATVEGARSRWNQQRTLIFTDYTLRVEDRLRGTAPERITLSIPGGTVDGETHDVCLATPLTAGARYLLFLQDLGRSQLVPITGGWQGAFREGDGTRGKSRFSDLVASARRLLAEVEEGLPSGVDSAFEAVSLREQSGEQPAFESVNVRYPALTPLVFETLPPGSPFHGADREQIEYWNLYADLFGISDDPTPGWKTGNGISEIAGVTSDEEMTQATGEPWSQGSLSATFSRLRDGHIVEADIALNPAFRWTLDEAAAMGRDTNLVSFRSSILGHLAYAWGYQGVSIAGLLYGERVTRDSLITLKPKDLDDPVVYAEDADAARAYHPARSIRDGLISAYDVRPGSGWPTYIPLRLSARAVKAGKSFDFRTPIKIENPGTEPLAGLNLEVYLVPKRYSLDRAVLVKRIRLGGELLSGEVQSVSLGRVTVPKKAPAGNYYVAVVLRDPQDAYQANNRAWGTEDVRITVTR